MNAKRKGRKPQMHSVSVVVGIIPCLAGCKRSRGTLFWQMHSVISCCHLLPFVWWGVGQDLLDHRLHLSIYNTNIQVFSRRVWERNKDFLWTILEGKKGEEENTNFIIIFFFWALWINFVKFSRGCILWGFLGDAFCKDFLWTILEGKREKKKILIWLLSSSSGFCG